MCSPLWFAIFLNLIAPGFAGSSHHHAKGSRRSTLRQGWWECSDGSAPTLPDGSPVRYWQNKVVSEYDYAYYGHESWSEMDNYGDGSGSGSGSGSEMDNYDSGMFSGHGSGTGSGNEMDDYDSDMFFGDGSGSGSGTQLDNDYGDMFFGNGTGSGDGIGSGSGSGPQTRWHNQTVDGAWFNISDSWLNGSSVNGNIHNASYLASNSSTLYTTPSELHSHPHHQELAHESNVSRNGISWRSNNSASSEFPYDAHAHVLSNGSIHDRQWKTSLHHRGNDTSSLLNSRLSKRERVVHNFPSCRDGSYPHWRISDNDKSSQKAGKKRSLIVCVLSVVCGVLLLSTVVLAAWVCRLRRAAMRLEPKLPVREPCVEGVVEGVVIDLEVLNQGVPDASKPTVD